MKNDKTYEGDHELAKGNASKKWDEWYSYAIKVGVWPELAQLGRDVIRDYWEHGHYIDDEMGVDVYLGADHHHKMMICLAMQKPDLAKAVFNVFLASGAPDEEQLESELIDVEYRYASRKIKPHADGWYKHIYKLEGCEWRLDNPDGNL